MLDTKIIEQFSVPSQLRKSPEPAGAAPQLEGEKQTQHEGPCSSDAAFEFPGRNMANSLLILHRRPSALLLRNPALPRWSPDFPAAYLTARLAQLSPVPLPTGGRQRRLLRAAKRAFPAPALTPSPLCPQTGYWSKLQFPFLPSRTKLLWPLTLPQQFWQRNQTNQRNGQYKR